MKKIYLLALAFVVAMATITPVYLAASNNTSREERLSTKEIVIRDIKYPPSTPRPRSAAPVISAYYSSDISLLEIYFNNPVGTVTINVLDEMQQCIGRYTCNTNNETVAFINLSLSPGYTYTIHIVGDEYEGIGYYIP